MAARRDQVGQRDQRHQRAARHAQALQARRRNGKRSEDARADAIVHVQLAQRREGRRHVRGQLAVVEQGHGVVRASPQRGTQARLLPAAERVAHEQIIHDETRALERALDGDAVEIAPPRGEEAEDRQGAAAQRVQARDRVRLAEPEEHVRLREVDARVREQRDGRVGALVAQKHGDGRKQRQQREQGDVVGGALPAQADADEPAKALRRALRHGHHVGRRHLGRAVDALALPAARREAEEDAPGHRAPLAKIDASEIDEASKLAARAGGARVVARGQRGVVHDAVQAGGREVRELHGKNGVMTSGSPRVITMFAALDPDYLDPETNLPREPELHLTKNFLAQQIKTVPNGISSYMAYYHIHGCDSFAVVFLLFCFGRCKCCGRSFPATIASKHNKRFMAALASRFRKMGSVIVPQWQHDFNPLIT